MRLPCLRDQLENLREREKETSSAPSRLERKETVGPERMGIAALTVKPRNGDESQARKGG